MIIEGMLSSLQGKFVEVDLDSTKPFSTVSNIEVYSGEFGYCTELIIKINDVEKFSKSKFISKIEKLGNSMVVVDDKDILKLHIHTVKPGEILFETANLTNQLMDIPQSQIDHIKTGQVILANWFFHDELDWFLCLAVKLGRNLGYSKWVRK